MSKATADEIAPVAVKYEAHQRRSIRPSHAYTATGTGSARANVAMLLQPNASGLPVLGLDAAAARSYVAAIIEGSVDPESVVVQRLVFDGVLEILDCGEYISGTEVVGRLWPVVSDIEMNSIGTISIDALRHAQRLGSVSMAAITRKLYSYNRVPLSARWCQLLAAPGSVLDILGLGATGSLRSSVERTYEMAPTTPWLHFRRRHGPHGGEPLAKLYVSPCPSDFRTVAAEAIRFFASTGVPAFKIASTPEGFVRPDKLVAYFAQPSEAIEAARALIDALSGFRPSAQPVPFSTSVTPDGLVSIGYLPPKCAEIAMGRRLSWRAWICQRLAAALVIAHSEGRNACEPWRFALTRLHLDGVDIRTWRPQ